MVKLIIHIHAFYLSYAMFKLVRNMSTPETYQFANCSQPIFFIMKCLSLKSTTVVINEKKHCGTEMRACQNCKDVQNDI